MEMTTELKTLTVTRKKDGAGGAFARGMSVIFGVLLLMLGALLFITIIGILPGIGCIYIGVAMIAVGAANKQLVKCPHCAKSQAIQKDVEDFECARCKKPVIMRWIKY